MNLYLMRHADALPVGGAITRDVERRLSGRGEEDARIMGRALSLLGPGVNIIVTSPLTRARETGAILGREIGNNPLLHVSEHLAPGLREVSLFRELIALGGGSDIVAIGHLPDISHFVSFLIGRGGSAAVAMSAGTVAKLVIEEGRPQGHLAWLLSPETVRNFLVRSEGNHESPDDVD